MSKASREHRVANIDRWKADHGRRSSNAAQPHTLKFNKGTRAAHRKRAVRDFD